MGVFARLFSGPETEPPFCFQIEDVFGIRGCGAVVVGHILTGRVRAGDSVVYRPAPEAAAAFSCRVEAIERLAPGTRKAEHPKEADAGGPLQGRCALLLREQEAPAFRPGGCLTREE